MNIIVIVNSIVKIIYNRFHSKYDFISPPRICPWITPNYRLIWPLNPLWPANPFASCPCATTPWLSSRIQGPAEVFSTSPTTMNSSLKRCSTKKQSFYRNYSPATTWFVHVLTYVYVCVNVYITHMSMCMYVCFTFITILDN